MIHDMMKCTICQIAIDRPRSNKCKNCVSKEVKRRYWERNKEKVKAYQNEYRKANKKLCQERSKISRLKKLDQYKLKTRQRYRINHGQPIDKPMTKRAVGEGNIDAQGYKTLTKRGHPNQMDSKGRIREHIFVMSEYLGRPLFKDESVHHKNGIRDDNRIENLELWSKGQPPGQRVDDKIKWYIEFLNMYGYKVIK